MSLKISVGIVGFGIMGQGIALVAAVSGCSLVIKSHDYKKLLDQRDIFSVALKKHLKRNPELEIDAEKALENIRFIDGYEGFSDCDLIIEAVNEDIQIKAEIFKSISLVVPDTTVIASNTSSLSITKLSGFIAHPQNFIGIHFMNPVSTMPLVEIVRGFSTSDSTFEKSIAFVESISKKHIVAKDFPGFALNRILIPMINEAIFALYEGIGTASDIDEALKLGANHPMGPLALADLIGLDTCLSIMKILASGFGDSKYRPCPLLVRYVECGWLGRKTNKGFYDYKIVGRPATWPLE